MGFKIGLAASLVCMFAWPVLQGAAQELEGKAQKIPSLDPEAFLASVAETPESCRSGEEILLDVSETDPALEGRGRCRVYRYGTLSDGPVRLVASATAGKGFILVADEAGEVLEDREIPDGERLTITLGVEAGVELRIVMGGSPHGKTMRLRFTPTEVNREEGLEEIEQAVERAGRLVLDASRALSRGDYGEARAKARQAFDALESLSGCRQHPGAVDLLSRIGNWAFQARDFLTACKAWDLVVAYCEQVMPPDDPVLITHKNSQVAILILFEQYQHAKPIVEEMLEACRSSGRTDQNTLNYMRVNYAIILRKLGNPYDARRIIEQAVAYFESCPSPQKGDLERVRINLADVLMDLGYRAEARDLFEKVLGVYEEFRSADDPEMLIVRVKLAGVTSDPDRAKELIRKVLESYERNPPSDPTAPLSARLTMANALSESGELCAARTVKEQVLEEASKAPFRGHPILQIARTELGLTLFRLGDLEQAERLFQEVESAYALSLPEEDLRLLDARNRIGGIRYARGDYEGAKSVFERSLEVYERTLSPEHPTLLATRLNLGLILYMLEEYGSAEGQLVQAVEAYERHFSEDHLYLQLARQYLAAVCKYQGNLEEAEALEAKVLGALEGCLPTASPHLQWARQNLAVTCLLDGRDEEAAALTRETLKYALDFISGVVRHGAVREIDEAARDSRRMLDRCFSLMAAGLLPEALCFEAAESLRSAGMRSGLIWRIMEEKGGEEIRRLKNALRERTNELAAAPPDRLSEAVKLRDQAERALNEAVSGLPGVEELRRFSKLEDVAGSLPEGWAGISFHRYERHGYPVRTMKDMDPTAHYFAFILHRSGEVDGIDLGEAAGIEGCIGAWRKGLTSQRTRMGTLTALGRKVYEKVWLPCEGKLAGVKSVVVAPDSVLATVPLEALPRKEGFLADRYHLAYANGLSTLAVPREEDVREGTAQRLVAMGGIDFDAEPGRYPTGNEEEKKTLRRPEPARLRSGPFPGEPVPALPGTALEVEEVARLYRENHGTEGYLVKGEAASKASLMALAPRAEYLHIATHGYFIPEAQVSSWDRGREGERDGAVQSGFLKDVKGLAPSLLCGLRLAGSNRLGGEAAADGIITGEEIRGLDLSHCKLAVLSACESNVGLERTGQGIMSFQRALAVAGARGSITSLWKVDDTATCLLFWRFYRLLWEEGLSPSEALREAKDWLRNLSFEELDKLRERLPMAVERGETASMGIGLSEPRGVYRSPFFWAGFVYWGEVE